MPSELDSVGLLEFKENIVGTNWIYFKSNYATLITMSYEIRIILNKNCLLNWTINPSSTETFTKAAVATSNLEYYF